MGAFISKQPNGLYCRFSAIVDTITHHNMTEEDYIELCVSRWGKEGVETAKDTIKNDLYSFQEVLDRFLPYNNTVEEFMSLLVAMGYEGSYDQTERL